ncbi:MAG: stage V sporulation protein SpoVM [Ruminococcus sp.]|nr:stage V sporulation protein SpoVM [Ruminococcus sp.]
MSVVCGRSACGKLSSIRVRCGCSGNHYHNYMQYVQEANELKVVLIENPKFLSFFLRKIYKIKKQKT